jgi:DinB family protein
MTSSDVLVDAFQRIRDAVHPAVNDLSTEQLAFRPDGGANSIGWLVWHLTRIQDDHVAELHGGEQSWAAGGWSERFALPLDPSDTGYGHGPDDVAKVTADAALLLGYFEAVHQSTMAYLGTLSDADLERVIDRSWDPPVTVGIRLVSVISDDLQHVGQAAYVRGVVQRLADSAGR